MVEELGALVLGLPLQARLHPRLEEDVPQGAAVAVRVAEGVAAGARGVAQVRGREVGLPAVEAEAGLERAVQAPVGVLAQVARVSEEVVVVGHAVPGQLVLDDFDLGALEVEVRHVVGPLPPQHDAGVDGRVAAEAVGLVEELPVGAVEALAEAAEVLVEARAPDPARGGAVEGLAPGAVRGRPVAVVPPLAHALARGEGDVPPGHLDLHRGLRGAVGLEENAVRGLEDVGRGRRPQVRRLHGRVVAVPVGEEGAALLDLVLAHGAEGEEGAVGDAEAGQGALLEGRRLELEVGAVALPLLQEDVGGRIGHDALRLPPGLEDGQPPYTRRQDGLGLPHVGPVHLAPRLPRAVVQGLEGEAPARVGLAEGGALVHGEAALDGNQILAVVAGHDGELPRPLVLEEEEHDARRELPVDALPSLVRASENRGQLRLRVRVVHDARQGKAALHLAVQLLEGEVVGGAHALPELVQLVEGARVLLLGYALGRELADPVAGAAVGALVLAAPAHEPRVALALPLVVAEPPVGAHAGHAHPVPAGALHGAVVSPEGRVVQPRVRLEDVPRVGLDELHSAGEGVLGGDVLGGDADALPARGAPPAPAARQHDHVVREGFQEPVPDAPRVELAQSLHADEPALEHGEAGLLARLQGHVVLGHEEDVVVGLGEAGRENHLLELHARARRLAPRAPEERGPGELVEKLRVVPVAGPPVAVVEVRVPLEAHVLRLPVLGAQVLNEGADALVVARRQVAEGPEPRAVELLAAPVHRPLLVLAHQGREALAGPGRAPGHVQVRAVEAPVDGRIALGPVVAGDVAPLRGGGLQEGALALPGDVVRARGVVDALHGLAPPQARRLAAHGAVGVDGAPHVARGARAAEGVALARGAGAGAQDRPVGRGEAEGLPVVGRPVPGALVEGLHPVRVVEVPALLAPAGDVGVGAPAGEVAEGVVDGHRSGAVIELPEVVVAAQGVLEGHGAVEGGQLLPPAVELPGLLRAREGHVGRAELPVRHLPEAVARHVEAARRADFGAHLQTPDLEALVRDGVDGPLADGGPQHRLGHADHGLPREELDLELEPPVGRENLRGAGVLAGADAQPQAALAEVDGEEHLVVGEGDGPRFALEVEPQNPGPQARPRVVARHRPAEERRPAEGVEVLVALPPGAHVPRREPEGLAVLAALGAAVLAELEVLQAVVAVHEVVQEPALPVALLARDVHGEGAQVRVEAVVVRAVLEHVAPLFQGEERLGHVVEVPGHPRRVREALRPIPGPRHVRVSEGAGGRLVRERPAEPVHEALHRVRRVAHGQGPHVGPRVRALVAGPRRLPEGEPRDVDEGAALDPLRGAVHRRARVRRRGQVRAEGVPVRVAVAGLAVAHDVVAVVLVEPADGLLADVHVLAGRVQEALGLVPGADGSVDAPAGEVGLVELQRDGRLVAEGAHGLQPVRRQGVPEAVLAVAHLQKLESPVPEAALVVLVAGLDDAPRVADGLHLAYLVVAHRALGEPRRGAGEVAVHAVEALGQGVELLRVAGAVVPGLALRAELRVQELLELVRLADAVAAFVRALPVAPRAGEPREADALAQGVALPVLARGGVALPGAGVLPPQAREPPLLAFGAEGGVGDVALARAERLARHADVLVRHPEVVAQLRGDAEGARLGVEVLQAVLLEDAHLRVPGRLTLVALGTLEAVLAPAAAVVVAEAVVAVHVAAEDIAAPSEPVRQALAAVVAPEVAEALARRRAADSGPGARRQRVAAAVAPLVALVTETEALVVAHPVPVARVLGVRALDGAVLPSPPQEALARRRAVVEADAVAGAPVWALLAAVGAEPVGVADALGPPVDVLARPLQTGLARLRAGRVAEGKPVRVADAPVLAHPVAPARLHASPGLDELQRLGGLREDFLVRQIGLAPLAALGPVVPGQTLPRARGLVLGVADLAEPPEPLRVQTLRPPGSAPAAPLRVREGRPHARLAADAIHAQALGAKLAPPGPDALAPVVVVRPVEAGDEHVVHLPREPLAAVDGDEREHGEKRSPRRENSELQPHHLWTTSPEYILVGGAQKCPNATWTSRAL